jgi:transposase
LQQQSGVCPNCHLRSVSRHGWHRRGLVDLPAMGREVVLKLQVSRWRCCSAACARQTFVAPHPVLFRLHGRRARRAEQVVRLIGHSVGGRPGERLSGRLGLTTSDDSIIRALKRGDHGQAPEYPVRVVGIDDWSQLKGSSYGTILIDLERRQVIDVLEDRSADAVERWFKRHPEVETISRDRCGLYARGATLGAPKAQQVADRFHLLENLRKSIEEQLSRSYTVSRRSCLPPSAADSLHASSSEGHDLMHSRAVQHQYLLRQRRLETRQELFEQVQRMASAGVSARDIAQEIGFNWRTVYRWLAREEPIYRSPLALKLSSPHYFEAFLKERWAIGDRSGRGLFSDIRHRGYTGSRSHLGRLLSRWRQAEKPPAQKMAEAIMYPNVLSATAQARDPLTGHLISPITAAALCIKPSGLLSPAQQLKVAALKAASDEFSIMRQLAMRFRGLLKSKDATGLPQWLRDAKASRLHTMVRYARVIARDLPATANAIEMPWSNGQTEGQVNRLKMLKRQMYGRAGVALLKARMLPLQ